MEINRDDDILLLVKFLNKKLREDFDKLLEESGLTGTQGRVLFYIKRQTDENNEMHQKDIEKFFRLSKSSVSGLIKRMESRSLIKKEYKPPYYVLEVTDKGSMIVEHVFNSRIGTIEKAFKGFDKNERTQITDCLKRMIENLEGGIKND